MNEFANLDTQNDVLRAINGDATSPVYSEGLREYQPSDSWHGMNKSEGSNGNTWAFLLATSAFTIASVLLW